MEPARGKVVRGNFHCPAVSGEPSSEICGKLAAAFGLPPFQQHRRSEYLETSRSVGGPFEAVVTEYIGEVSLDDLAIVGPPDYYPLAMRAAFGFRFNYLVALTAGDVTRNERRTMARKLRSVFAEIKLHGASAK